MNIQSSTLGAKLSDDYLYVSNKYHNVVIKEILFTAIFFWKYGSQRDGFKMVCKEKMESLFQNGPCQRKILVETFVKTIEIFSI